MNVTFEGNSTTGKNQWLTPPELLAKLGQFDLDAIALTFSRTETKLFQELIFKKAHSILFIKGRLSFHHVTGERGGTAGAPSCLISFNEVNSEILKSCGIKGKFILL